MLNVILQTNGGVVVVVGSAGVGRRAAAHIACAALPAALFTVNHAQEFNSQLKNVRTKNIARWFTCRCRWWKDEPIVVVTKKNEAFVIRDITDYKFCPLVRVSESIGTVFFFIHQSNKENAKLKCGKEGGNVKSFLRKKFTRGWHGSLIAISP